MANKRNHLAAFFLGALFIAGCGNSKSFTPSQPLGGTAVSFSLTDTPPANVDVISFEVTVSGAALNPGNINLLGATGPQDIDVKKLQVEKAFLNTSGVPATSGPFQSLTLTFANPQLTILDGTAKSLAGCAPAHASFEGIANVAALVITPVPDAVSVRGWLFMQPSSNVPLLVASKLRKH